MVTNGSATATSSISAGADLVPRRHDVAWMTAAPLWRGLLSGPDQGPDQIDRLSRPVVLRMDSDDFMDDLASVLLTDPSKLSDLEATPRTYRPPPPAAPPDYVAPIDHVKLFQPVHGHFNLVAATLACRVVGLPDKELVLTCKESVSFTLRRIQGDTELAWTTLGWVPLPDPTELADGEELSSLFAMPSTDDDRSRRVFVGLIPTASLASSKSRTGSLAADDSGAAFPDPPDPRVTELGTKVAEGLRGLRAPQSSPPSDPAAVKADKAARVTASQFILLDLADFLIKQIPSLWTAVQSRQDPGTGVLHDAYVCLEAVADQSLGVDWIAALVKVVADRDRIWGEDPRPPSFLVDLSNTPMLPDPLATKIGAALPPLAAGSEPPAEASFASPKLDPRPSVRYVIRCVYQRPCCRPPLPDLLSEPTEPFAIAPFFDVDAPARQLHISMPMDTSIAGLRKAPKNVSVLMSRELRGQMQRVTGLKATMDGQLASGEPIDLGLICSFSLPIITICALVVLMIFLILLNIVFWWLPFFRICFGIPLKGKD